MAIIITHKVSKAANTDLVLFQAKINTLNTSFPTLLQLSSAIKEFTQHISDHLPSTLSTPQKGILTNAFFVSDKNNVCFSWDGKNCHSKYKVCHFQHPIGINTSTQNISQHFRDQPSYTGYQQLCQPQDHSRDRDTQHFRQLRDRSRDRDAQHFNKPRDRSRDRNTQFNEPLDRSRDNNTQQLLQLFQHQFLQPSNQKQPTSYQKHLFQQDIDKHSQSDWVLYRPNTPYRQVSPPGC